MLQKQQEGRLESIRKGNDSDLEIKPSNSSRNVNYLCDGVTPTTIVNLEDKEIQGEIINIEH